VAVLAKLDLPIHRNRGSMIWMLSTRCLSLANVVMRIWSASNVNRDISRVRLARGTVVQWEFTNVSNPDRESLILLFVPIK
jgi:hypothetical protein